MKKLAMVGDDGTRPNRSVLVSAKLVDGKVRLVIDRVRNDGETWRAETPVTFKDFERASFDAMPDDDLRALGEIVVVELGVQIDRSTPP